ncbi:MAG: hypothetical protein HN494_04210 [Opitutae bacterium]|nr:hypothetical protein [Opitutae bacterium]
MAFLFGLHVLWCHLVKVNVMFRSIVVGFFLLGRVFGAEPSGGRLLEGTGQETPWHRVASGEPGPVVIIVGGMHGNEPAGARAAEQIRHWTLKRGELIVIPRANVAGLRARIRFVPNRSPATSDLNRNFPKTDDDNETVGDLAAGIWRLVGECKPDWLLDLHEGSDFHQINKKSVGSSIIPTKGVGMDDAVQKALAAVNLTIDEPKKKLVRLRYPVNGSLARAAHERLGARSMILETTVKEQPLSRRSQQHRIMVHAVLSHLGMVSSGVHLMARPLATVPEDERSRRIAIYDAGGTGGAGARRLEAILWQMPKALTRRVGPPEIRAGALTQFDLVVFPGGSGSRQAAALEKEGRGAVRRFVEAGGSYLGVCAGAYLAAENYSWSLKIIDAKTVDTKNGHWKRGEGMVKMELTKRGRELLGDFGGAVDVRYANGPIFAPAGMEELSDFEALAHFRSEFAKNGARPGVMVDSPAILCGPMGKGKVICISPHPESAEALHGIIRRSATWLVEK